MNRFGDLERRLELRQTLFLVGLRYGFVGLKRRDLILDLLGWLGELLGLGSMPDMITVIFVNTSSYWARLAKPFFLARAAACASTFGS